MPEMQTLVAIVGRLVILKHSEITHIEKRNVRTVWRQKAVGIQFTARTAACEHPFRE